ncbi:MAG: ATP synthase F1 subunit epsilon [Patescibacteria group bacterium]|nr:ATP synthase F1 subunit epsilon [Patescibacteria group bacterium]
MSLTFELVTPERVVFSQEIDQVTLPTRQGEITILPNHIPLVAALIPGVAHLKKGQSEEDVAVSGGFIEISADNHVRVLADTAERGIELDLSIIEEAKARAEKVMQETVRTDDESFAAAAIALERELARYKVAIKHRGSKKVPIIDQAIKKHETRST